MAVVLFYVVSMQKIFLRAAFRLFLTLGDQLFLDALLSLRYMPHAHQRMASRLIIAHHADRQPPPLARREAWQREVAVILGECHAYRLRHCGWGRYEPELLRLVPLPRPLRAKGIGRLYASFLRAARGVLPPG